MNFSEHQLGREWDLLRDGNPGWKEDRSFWSTYSREPGMEFTYVVRSYRNKNKSYAKFKRVILAVVNEDRSYVLAEPFAVSLYSWKSSEPHPFVTEKTKRKTPSSILEMMKRLAPGRLNSANTGFRIMSEEISAKDKNRNSGYRMKDLRQVKNVINKSRFLAFGGKDFAFLGSRPGVYPVEVNDGSGKQQVNFIFTRNHLISLLGRTEGEQIIRLC